MKSYPEQLAELLANAPPVPALRRKSAADPAHVSDETKAKLIAIHAAYATFGHPADSTQYSM